MNLNQDFDIVKLIELARYKKYETTVAGFGVIDKLERVSIPKKLKSRKIAVQSLYALSENLVQHKFLSKEEKQKIKEEIDRRNPTGSTKTHQIFSTTSAPISTEESEEDELPAEEAFRPDYIDDRYNEDTMQEEGDLDDDSYDDDSEEEEED
jgi:hypothetical protein